MPAFSLIFVFSLLPAPSSLPVPSASPATQTSPRSTRFAGAATTVPGPGASPLPSSGAIADDHARALLGGVWQCDTVAGSTGTHTYTANEDDGSIELQTTLQDGFRTVKMSEVYRFDEARNVWTAQIGDAYRGTARPWTSAKWIFDGTERSRGQVLPVRMIYFDLGAQAFRRDFQARQDGVWRTYSAETCTRPSN